MAVSPRPPGSSMKLWTYTAAIESGKFTMTTPVADSPITINMPGQQPHYQPKNYDGRYHGTCILQACIGNSLNVPAVKVELGTGIDRVLDVARRVGAPALLPNVNSQNEIVYSDPHNPSLFGAALTLGSYGETVLQQATGAATLADMGMYHQPFGIARIVTNEGKEIQGQWDPGKTAKQVLDPRVAFIMAQILSNNNNRAMIFGLGSPLTLPNRRVAAKTGTTENYKDAWTVGFTPSLARVHGRGAGRHERADLGVVRGPGRPERQRQLQRPAGLSSPGHQVRPAGPGAAVLGIVVELRDQQQPEQEARRLRTSLGRWEGNRTSFLIAHGSPGIMLRTKASRQSVTQS